MLPPCRTYVRTYDSLLDIEFYFPLTVAAEAVFPYTMFKLLYCKKSLSYKL